MDENLTSNETPSEPGTTPQANKTPRRPSRMLELSCTHPQTTVTSIMTSSPTRRRVALTPSQTWKHATGSFIPPEPHVHGEWTYCGGETIPEVDPSSPGTTPFGSGAIVPLDVSTSASLSDLHTSPTTSYATPLPGYRSRSGSVHYSTAHRRVPSSPSFRSSLTLVPHNYFDRPPSRSSSISSRYSEHSLGANLSLSELLAGTASISLGQPSTEDVDEPVRRDMQREERKQAMRERHVAIRERRERENWANV
ncbi:hypothetical protein FRC11_013375 [Ceratobasidium sp. 423]|nr:hypothetical protein FRC11_013375 [Ceratobasidium sp. 423]